MVNRQSHYVIGILYNIMKLYDILVKLSVISHLIWLRAYKKKKIIKDYSTIVYVPLLHRCIFTLYDYVRNYKKNYRQIIVFKFSVDLIKILISPI